MEFILFYECAITVDEKICSCHVQVADCTALNWEAGSYMDGTANRFKGSYIYAIKNYKKIWDYSTDSTYATSQGFGTDGIERIIILNKHV